MYSKHAGLKHRIERLEITACMFYFVNWATLKRMETNCSTLLSPTTPCPWI